MIVMKFGGTSVKDASSLKAALRIVCDHLHIEGGQVVVLSATSGTTNHLLKLARDAANDLPDLEERCDAIRDRHLAIARELINDESTLEQTIRDILSLSDELREYIHSVSILNECTDQSVDRITSFGERYSTCIFQRALELEKEFRDHNSLDADAESVRRSVLVDARTCIRTDSNFMNAGVDFEKTSDFSKENIASHLRTGSVVVTQGFVGADEDQNTTTLGRGGSDASAAILGAVLKATEIKIWTDVSGVYSADPRLVPDAKPVPTLSFSEVRELSLYGTKVLHPDTIACAIKNGVPVHVLNTFDPEADGTVITGDRSAHSELHAVSVVTDCIMITGATGEVRRSIRTGNLLSRLLLEVASLEHAVVVVSAGTDEDETVAQVAVAGLELKTTPVCLSVVTGPGAGSPETLALISKALSHLPLISIVSGTSDWATFVVMPADRSEEVVNALHKLVH